MKNCEHIFKKTCPKESRTDSEINLTSLPAKNKKKQAHFFYFIITIQFSEKMRKQMRKEKKNVEKCTWQIITSVVIISKNRMSKILNFCSIKRHMLENDTGRLLENGCR